MIAVRSTLAAILLSVVASIAAAQVSLSTTSRDGDLSRVQVALEVNGHVRHQHEGQPKQIPFQVDGSLVYHERLVRKERNLSSVRYYDKSLAKINLDGDVVEPTFREDRRLIVAQPSDTGIILFSPSGTLRREELDIIDIQGNTLLLPKLLPGQSVKVGQSWKIKDGTLAELLSLDKLSSNSVKCKLTKVESGVAHIAIEGSVSGSVDGSLTEIVLKGTLGFHAARSKIAWLTLNLDENRMAGPAGPGVKLSGKLRVTISPLETSEQLSDTALADVSLAPTAPLVLLRHDAASGRFRAWHDRRWHVVDQREGSTVLRMIDHGQRVAQCNINIAEPAEDEKSTLTLAKFRAEVQKALTHRDAKITSSKEYKGRTNHKVYGVKCAGKVAGVNIAWHYFHVLNTKTLHRATLVITLEASRADALERTDLMIARSMQLLDVEKEVASGNTDVSLR
ncbi:MAG: hypothetical protein MI757_18850 [Pirellulales bacterium]|nr:hypothetical protein [Pirellulales bacterium]